MKRLFFLASIFTFILAACNKDLIVEIGSTVELTANINVFGVVSEFKNVSGQALFTNGELSQGQVVEVHYTVYNEEGLLVFDEIYELPHFLETKSIEHTLTKGKYTIVACAFVTYKNSNTEFWRPQDKDNLKSYRIKYAPVNNWIGSNGVLGVWKETVSISRPQNININMQPVVSMFIVNFTNCNLSDLSRIGLNLATFNDYFGVDGWQNQVNQLNTTINYSLEVTASSRSAYICYLPTSQMTINWTGYDASDKEVVNGTVPSSAVTAGETKVITVDTRSSSAPTYTMTGAEGEYWGNWYDTNTGSFNLWLYNDDIEVGIEGFGTRTFNPANFKLDAGTYTFAKTGAVRTFWEGSEENEFPYKTYFYNIRTGTHVEITGGTFTVSQTGSNYTISTNFTGIDANSGATVNNIIVNYTGPVSFDNWSYDIAESTYNANGSPKYLSTPGNSNWTGKLELIEEGDKKQYDIINWAGRGNNYNVLLTHRDDGTIVIDPATVVVQNETYNGYFRIGYFNDNGDLLIYRETASLYNQYTIEYDPTTQTLDFSGTVTVSDKTYQAVVGIAAYPKANPEGTWESVFSDFYADLKLKLTSISGMSTSSHKQLNKKANSSRIRDKSLKLKKLNNIVVNDEAQGQKTNLKNIIDADR